MGVACCKTFGSATITNQHQLQGIIKTNTKVKIESASFEGTQDLLHLGENYNGNSMLHGGLNSTVGNKQYPLKHYNTLREKVRKVPQQNMFETSSQHNNIEQEVKASEQTQPFFLKVSEPLKPTSGGSGDGGGKAMVHRSGTNPANHFTINQQNQDDCSVYSSQSQLIMGSFYDKQSMTGGISEQACNNLLIPNAQASPIFFPGQFEVMRGGQDQQQQMLVHQGTEKFLGEKFKQEKSGLSILREKRSGPIALKTPLMRGAMNKNGQVADDNQQMSHSEAAHGFHSANSYYSSGNNTVGQNGLFKIMISNQSSNEKNDQELTYSEGQIPQVNILPHQQSHMIVRSSFGDHQTSYFPNTPNSYHTSVAIKLEELKSDDLISMHDIVKMQGGAQINTSGCQHMNSLDQQNNSNDLQSLGSIQKSDTLIKQQLPYVKQCSNFTFLRGQNSIRGNNVSPVFADIDQSHEHNRSSNFLMYKRSMRVRRGTDANDSSQQLIIRQHSVSKSTAKFDQQPSAQTSLRTSSSLEGTDDGENEEEAKIVHQHRKEETKTEEIKTALLLIGKVEDQKCGDDRFNTVKEETNEPFETHTSQDPSALRLKKDSSQLAEITDDPNGFNQNLPQISMSSMIPKEQASEQNQATIKPKPSINIIPPNQKGSENKLEQQEEFKEPVNGSQNPPVQVFHYDENTEIQPHKISELPKQEEIQHKQRSLTPNPTDRIDSFNNNANRRKKMLLKLGSHDQCTLNEEVQRKRKMFFEQNSRSSSFVMKLPAVAQQEGVSPFKQGFKNIKVKRSGTQIFDNSKNSEKQESRKGDRENIKMLKKICGQVLKTTTGKEDSNSTKRGRDSLKNGANFSNTTSLKSSTFKKIQFNRQNNISHQEGSTPQTIQISHYNSYSKDSENQQGTPSNKHRDEFKINIITPATNEEAKLVRTNTPLEPKVRKRSSNEQKYSLDANNRTSGLDINNKFYSAIMEVADEDQKSSIAVSDAKANNPSSTLDEIKNYQLRFMGNHDTFSSKTASNTYNIIAFKNISSNQTPSNKNRIIVSQKHVLNEQVRETPTNGEDKYIQFCPDYTSPKQQQDLSTSDFKNMAKFDLSNKESSVDIDHGAQNFSAAIRIAKRLPSSIIEEVKASNINGKIENLSQGNKLQSTLPNRPKTGMSTTHTILLPDSMLEKQATYKYSHNAPNVSGRNLIKSIKRVVQKNENGDLSKIPSLLQEVRITSIKNQLQKQLKETHQIIDTTFQSSLAIRLPSNLGLRRRASLNIEHNNKGDSDRIILMNKNTMMIDEDYYNTQNGMKPLDDQSFWSNNTPFNHDFHYKVRDDYRNSEGSSDEDDLSNFDGNGFNPYDYTYEEVFDDSQFDCQTSLKSKDTLQGMSSIDPKSLNSHIHNLNLQKRTSHLFKTTSLKQNSFTPITQEKHNAQIQEQQSLPLREVVPPERQMIRKMETSEVKQIKKSQISNKTQVPNPPVIQQPSSSNAAASTGKSQTFSFVRQDSQQPESSLLMTFTMPARIMGGNKTNAVSNSSETNSNLTGVQVQNNATQSLNTNLDQSKQQDKNLLSATTKVGKRDISKLLIQKLVDQTQPPVVRQESNFSNLSSSIFDELANNDNQQSLEPLPIDRKRKISQEITQKDEYKQMRTTTDSPKTTKIAAQLNKLNLLGLDNLPVRGNSLSPMSNRSSNLKSQRSVTTISAVSKKVGGKKVINQYIVLKKIGRGKFAKVVQCMDQNTKDIFAMKIMNKAKLKKIFVSKTKHAYNAVETEIAVLKMLDHPNIVRLYETIDDPAHDKLFLITEFVKNGTLESRIANKNKQSMPLNEEQCRKYFRQLISAIEYCHENAKIIHRDIKPENILIDENDNIKLSDFGVSFIMENGTDEIQNSAGSYYYYSPEACLGAAYKGRKSDIWACGVTLYYMIYKQHPFEASLIPELFKKIQSEEPTFRPGKSSQYTFEVNNSMKDLVKKILTKNPETRFNLVQIKNHPWITNNGADPMPELKRCELEPSQSDLQNAFGELKNFGTIMLRKLSKMLDDNTSNNQHHSKTPGLFAIMKSNIEKNIVT